MEFGILGPLRVRTGDGRSLPVTGTKPRTMLAALLLAGGRVLPDDRLAALLWGGREPATMAAQLHTYASRLRRALDVPLVRSGPGYLLERGMDVRFDADEFERLTLSGHRDLEAGLPELAVTRLRAALDLWRGPALADVSETLRAAELPRLEEIHMAAVEGRIAAELALGQHLRAVPDLVGLVARYPLRERLRAQLVTALHRSDRRTDALGVYAQGRRILDEELGVAPGPALRAAYQSVLSA
ncbi:AfsR/SARP family transcriptional regulator [Amycolatopsis magusensis]|uniref:DNA-binding SARP family transcriptional activator n=2 Tax=Amycolatopsis magusensis TaxID=882444 RepID=A0ABS4PQR8_9PSEU|nr:AfsR/SARP family transcriptional regulator [Amycolatopsis magusensis]MBP2181762.1 DNA-binding SARP family transcriptional activator [Amycolatopsis magusensis]